MKDNMSDTQETGATPSAPKVVVGFKETKEVIDLAIALGSGIAKSLEDDKITFEDLPNFWAVIFAVMPAFEGLDQVAIEFQLATEEETAELKAYIKEQLDLPDDKLEEFIEDAFAVVIDIWMLVKRYFMEGSYPTLVPTPAE